MTAMPIVANLSDGRSIAIDDELADRLLCGVLVVDGLCVNSEGGAHAAATTLGAELAVEHAGRQPSQISGLTEARRLYKSCGMDPSRHRPSSEALLRRAMKGKDLYRISNVVDTCNLASLQFLLPIGMYDLARVEGDVTLRLGCEGHEYLGIRKGPVHLAGRLGLFDSAGPFGSPTSDSARTCVTDATTSVLAVVMATAAYPVDRMKDNLEVFSTYFTDHCAGRETWRGLLARETR